MEKFSDYINFALDNFAAFEARQAELLAQLEPVRQTYRETKADRSKSAAEKQVAKERLEVAEKAYSAAIAAARGEALSAMTQTRNELEATVKDFLTVKPGAMDGNAVALLNSGVLTADDLVALAAQFGDNATMLRVIAGAAQRLDDSRAQGLALQISGFLGPDARTAKLDGFIAQIRQGLTANPLYTSAIHTAMAEGVGARFAGDMEKMEVFTPAD
jgi:hypothetical protein